MDMDKLERVIEGLKVCTNPATKRGCLDGLCPYDGKGCRGAMEMDALELLKEQEAVTIKKTKEHGFGVYGGICPKCRNWIQSAHSFCGFCGQAVKWDD